MSTLSISKAIREGLHEEMVRDENVVVLGEDMAVMGNVFAITQGFLDEFGPNRVIDTPISESGFTGMAVGMAMRGLRPVVEWMYDDFITVCLDPVMNQAAKMRYMTGGQVKIPIVFRAPIGAGRRNAGQHSQCLEALFTHIPGLKVVCPSTGADAKGLLKSAIRCDDPVVFLEHKLLYAKKEQIPDGEYLIPGQGGCEAARQGPDHPHLVPAGVLLSGGRRDPGRPGHRRRGSGPADPGAPGLGGHPRLCPENRQRDGGGRGRPPWRRGRRAGRGDPGGAV